MRYKPRYKTARELLREACYTGEGVNRGYIRQHVNGTDRFHALIELDGIIDLHKDTTHGKDHFSQKFTPAVEREIARFRKLDRHPLWEKVYRFYKRIYKIWNARKSA